MNPRFILRSLVLLVVVACCLAAPADEKKNPDDVLSNSVLPESEKLPRANNVDATIPSDADDAGSPSTKNPNYSEYISSIFQIPISILQAVRDLFTGGSRKA